MVAETLNRRPFPNTLVASNGLRRGPPLPPGGPLIAHNLPCGFVLQDFRGSAHARVHPEIETSLSPAKLLTSYRGYPRGESLSARASCLPASLKLYLRCSFAIKGSLEGASESECRAMTER